MDYFALGKRIRKRRVEQGMTQEQLARQVGVTTSFIGHLERGSRTVRNDSGPDGLSRGQRYVMHEILSTLQSHLDDWNGPSAEG